ncbi:MAG: alpha/beta hydrolase [Alphaproteobacteria bacterium]|nr:alpha/beta hydrolase [Alphaproteobacteria bacterium]MCW5742416.1 alpha/beta hydrolase [Alphaproteobacteria bacterium]
MNMRRFTISLPDGEMAAIRFGTDGPPDLVFLHATGFNALTYRELLAPLGGRFRVVALDQRGHGLSRLPAVPGQMPGWELYGRDMLAVFDALGDGPPLVLAGHSMGGAVAMMAAEQRPGRVASLVLLDPVMPTAEWVAKLYEPTDLDSRIDGLPIARGARRRRAWFADKREAIEAYRDRGAFATWVGRFLDDYVEDGFTPMPDGDGVTLACEPIWEATTFASSRQNGADLLARVKVPVTILIGENGSVSRSALDAGSRTTARRTIDIVPGTTHFLPMERPDIVRQRLIAALEARSRVGAGMVGAPGLEPGTR